MIECSTIGVGRNIEILRFQAEKTNIHIIAPTGIYREAYTPSVFMNSSIDDLVKLWTDEITQGIESSESRAGFIKIAVIEEGPTKLEKRNIRAAARTSIATGAAFASHTIGGQAVLKILDILSGEGLNLEKFVWVHADSEPNLDIHREVINMGAYVEFDSIGQPGRDHAETVDKVLSLIKTNDGDRILLSYDAGWYQPGQPNGFPEDGIRGFTSLSDEFIPLLRKRGFEDQTIQLLTEDNPKRAFAIQAA